MVPTFTEKWGRATSLSQFELGDTIHIEIMVGLTEEAKVLGIGDSSGDPVVLARTISNKLVRITNPKQAYVDKKKLLEIRSETINKEGGNPMVVSDNTITHTTLKHPPLKGVSKNPVTAVKANTNNKKEVTVMPTVNVVSEATETPTTNYMSMAALARAAGLSVLTIRKYLDKHGEAIPFVDVNGTRKFTQESVDAVLSIKSENLAKWGPKVEVVGNES